MITNHYRVNGMLPPPQSFSLNLTLADNDVHNLFPANFLRKQYEWIQTSSNADHYISSEVGLFIAKHHKSSFWCMNLLIKLKRFPNQSYHQAFTPKIKLTLTNGCAQNKRRIYHMENKIRTSDVFPKIFLKKEKDLQQ